ncbi:MAG: hypothetical protein JWP03_1029 [Phycisphaerales bacterium]|nr:hypothetical protein [Phycisphaerales bacterium]
MPATPASINLLHDVRSLVARHRWLAQKQGLQFNVFDILGLTSNEVRCHSAFLASMLDPDGPHGQGDLFLRLFLKEICELGHPSLPSDPEFPATSPWRVLVESRFSLAPTATESALTGRIDLLLECGDRWIIIENKIYADDQPLQLERYERYARKRNKASTLIYLTLEGGEPDAATLGTMSKDRVIPIGYGILIDSWLDECIKAAALVPAIRESLAQYQRLVRRLSGGGLGRELTMEIADQLMTPSYLEAAMEIERALVEAKTRVQFAFWSELREQLESRFTLGPSQFMNAFAPSRDKIRTYSLQGPQMSRQFGLSLPIETSVSGRTIALLLTVYNNVYFAVAAVEDDGWAALTSTEKAWVEAALEHAGTVPKREAGRVWFPSSTRLPFKDFGPECVKLADEQARRQRIDEIVDEAARLLPILKNSVGATD